MNKTWRFLLVAAVIMTTACMKRSAIWVMPGSTAQRLVLLVGEKRGGATGLLEVDQLRVATCRSSSQPSRPSREMWSLRSSDHPNGHALTRIAYADVVPGFKSEAAAEALVPGCYEASISGIGISASTEFLVSPDGHVTTRR